MPNVRNGWKQTFHRLVNGLLGCVEVVKSEPWRRQRISFLTVMLVVFGLEAGCSTQPTVPDRTGVAAGYDSAAKTLKIDCLEAVRGRCEVLVQDVGAQTSLGILVGKHVTLAEVSSEAKTCSLSAGTRVDQCTWVPVDQTGT